VAHHVEQLLQLLSIDHIILFKVDLIKGFAKLYLLMLSSVANL
jgi:hypothetical protein